jgi:uncharacterized protein (DUF302 family)
MMRPQEDSKTLTRISHLVQIEHVRVWTARPFSDVVRRLEAETGVFDSAAIQALVAAKAPPSSAIEAIAAMAGRSGLMRFSALDHGAILRLQGKPADAVRFLIGDPLTASRMTKLRIGSALYAPLSLLVAADERGGTRLEYDLPSTLFSQFEDPGVAKVASELDDKLAALVHSVAGAVEG